MNSETISRIEPMIRQNLMDAFVRQYTHTAIWMLPEDDSGALSSRAVPDEAHMTREARRTARAECLAFVQKAFALIVACRGRVELTPEPGLTKEEAHWAQVAHDFFMTRNGHGVGFWDGDYPMEEGLALTEIAKSFGENTLYQGDDRLLYWEVNP